MAKEQNDIMVCEFDYAQNLPLPKLTVKSKLYKRLLWLYLFNVHIHNDDASFMYSFIESLCKKGENTVVSFIFDYIQKKNVDFLNVKKLIFMSDSAGGQNKNQTFLRFCSYLSKSLNVEIMHISLVYTWSLLWTVRS